MQVVDQEPDNETWLELARIDLQEGVTEVSDADDAASPGGNEIDRRYVVRAGSVGIVEPQLPPDVLGRIVVVMEEKRRDFAALARCLPVPSVEDVHTAALTVKILARAGILSSEEQVVDILADIVEIELEVELDIERVQPNVVEFPQFVIYREKVHELWSALRGGASLDDLLNQQGVVSEKVRILSEVIGTAPVADTGIEEGVLTVTTPGDEATVSLDASGSSVFGEREIVGYCWKKKE